MKVLILGKSGQVATALAQAGAGLPAGSQVEAWGRDQLDLADVANVFDRLMQSGAGAIINAAAYTAVDKAESDEDAAVRLNAEGPAQAARAARALNIPFVQISTDFVFSGNKASPYIETDALNPLSAYGRSKVLGEQLVIAAHEGATILRTAWVFHEHGGNFVKTMLRLGRERDELRVVADQHGSPTYAGDIASACLKIIEKAAAGDSKAQGVFHFSGAGSTTWYGFALEIFGMAAELGYPAPKSVVAVGTAEYPTPATRPANSRLDCGKIERELGIAPPDWRVALKACVASIVDAQPKTV